ncbi:hypothetical protein SEA_PANAMAXUS_39 [Mycobacterium phage Panamaxus]|uniref:Uncharacterized protein n=1 Tax=Mycobacterium phage Veracruz TaxID=2530154 RepID=A0A481VTA7_9CAUD|nr:hypothetical protein KIP27_gp52 [Mycobacterium phage Veracruz]AIS73714.1 hypothetical protein PBI_QUINNKIRO_40 [Mycobacterium phage QuinnKiro]AOT24190.1 hypothetical protein SEA_TODACORO_41 [Mycobacterium phage Todacoro]AOT25543.1 hypothetical protein SEA_MARGO_41 [Mycobacterium phage Margo]AUX82337.1 hypothetical protein SEA_LAMBERT1_41 [Mycobacterium phage Lambert1]AVP42958.1 hypothetical protein SEA_PANAMAXUS_39 [Mycobacterium phage Panamaxus]AWY03572.1 hypothetical protein SEA_HOOKMOUN
MADIPWFPEYYVEVSDSDSRSFITNSVLLRITTRVPQEQLEDVIKTLLPNQPLPPAMKEVVRGRS